MIITIYIIVGIILSFKFYKIEKKEEWNIYRGRIEYETNVLQVFVWIILWPIFLLDSIKIK